MPQKLFSLTFGKNSRSAHKHQKDLHGTIMIVFKKGQDIRRRSARRLSVPPEQCLRCSEVISPHRLSFLGGTQIRTNDSHGKFMDALIIWDFPGKDWRA
jgi:ribosomal protein L32